MNDEVTDLIDQLNRQIEADRAERERRRSEGGVRVDDLEPGDVVHFGAGEAVATFVAVTGHPIWPSLALVTWRLGSPDGPRGGWLHDALDWRQEVGSLLGGFDRLGALRWALLGGDR